MIARIVVLNWNGRSWLEGCLSALERERSAGVEVVLVDNGSTDDSVALVAARFPWVQIVALPSNTGFARGNNLGARGAQAKYLVFLNNDTEVEPGWLAALVGEADRDSAIGLVTSRIVFRDQPAIIDSAGDGYLQCGGAFKRLHGRGTIEASAAREVFGACGAACLIRRDLFETLEGFDETFYMVYEDVDLSYRARLAGARIVYAPGAVVNHAGSATIGRSSVLAVYCGQRNLEWTWLQNTPAPLLVRSLLPHLAYSLAAGVVYARRGQGWTWVRAKLAALRGIRRVLRRRRVLQARIAIAPDALWQIMDPEWVGIKKREKGFDFLQSEPAALNSER